VTLSYASDRGDKSTAKWRQAMAKKQLKIPGTEGETIKELNDAAEAYVTERDKRMKLTEKEVAAKDTLINVMKNHKLSVYKDDDADPPLIITLTAGKDQLKVTREESDEDAAEKLSA
jgi:hypothetical protein